MAFETQHTSGNDSKGSTKNVDFDALNQYVIDTVGLEDRKTLSGYISQIIDLGTQELEDAETEFKGNADEEASIIAENADTYFKNGIDRDTGKPVRLKCWPQKPQQCVAIAVDFPRKIVDKGNFFGNSKPLPLRLWLGGQFYNSTKKVMLLGRPTPLKVTNLDKTRATKVWSLAQNNLLYKLAVGAGLIKPGEAFLPGRIDELLGAALQWSVQVYNKPAKTGDKKFYTEYISYVGALSEDQVVPEQLTTPYMVQMNQPNEDEAVKFLPSHVVNMIRLAENFAGSAMEKQLEGRGNKGGTPAKSDADKPQGANPKPQTKGQTAAEKQAALDDAFDDDLPF
jgi:hypothetical protein